MSDSLRVTHVMTDLEAIVLDIQKENTPINVSLHHELPFRVGMIVAALHVPNNKLRVMTLLLQLAATCVVAVASMRAGTFDFDGELAERESLC